MTIVISLMELLPRLYKPSRNERIKNFIKCQLSTLLVICFGLKLCNGTRLKVVTLKKFLIECTILTGNKTDETVFIPKTPMTPSELPF